MQSARIWRHSKAERRSNRSAEPGTMTEGPNGTPQGASRKGPNRLLATHYAESLATSHLAQPAEPPYADPHVRWCGRGGRATVPPIPIAAYQNPGGAGIEKREVGPWRLFRLLPLSLRIFGASQMLICLGQRPMGRRESRQASGGNFEVDDSGFKVARS